MTGWGTGIYRVEVGEAVNQIIWHYLNLLLSPATEYTSKQQNKGLLTSSQMSGMMRLRKPVLNQQFIILSVIKSISFANMMFRCPE